MNDDDYSSTKAFSKVMIAFPVLVILYYVPEIPAAIEWLQHHWH